MLRMLGNLPRLYSYSEVGLSFIDRKTFLWFVFGFGKLYQVGQMVSLACVLFFRSRMKKMLNI